MMLVFLLHKVILHYTFVVEDIKTYNENVCACLCAFTSATRTLCCIFFLDFMMRTMAASISCLRSSSTFCRVSFLSGSDSPCLAATGGRKPEETGGGH